MVSTTSVYKPEIDGGGRRILVTRYYPRGVRRSHFDDWIRALAPSAALLRAYKGGEIAEGEFMGRFVREIEASGEAQAALLDLRRAAVSAGITLLCYEPSGAPCHRHILRRLVEEPGVAWNGLEPDYTDYHKGVPVAGLVAH